MMRGIGMPHASAKKHLIHDRPTEVYETPRLRKLKLSAEQLSRINDAANPRAELALVYREITAS